MSDASNRLRRAPNRLAGQTSPYLLQHAHNPVDWHPWGPEALARARGEDKPIFLSIGYAACHWCHVMERESFEDDEVAAFLREHFVAIKVDREERPDLDEIYMTAVQMMTGQGGWPLTVFLTPDREPFFGGTYFPPEDGYGRPGFLSLLRRIREVWTDRRGEVARQASELTAHLRRLSALEPEPAAALPGRGEIAQAAADLARRFDPRWGGFGGAPKFPPDSSLALLLREHARSGDAGALGMVRATLDRMALGGMYDHVGGGFCRYSVDERWLVPHFEKMLYNQALLVPLYVDGWLLTRSALDRRTAEETLDFVRRELTDPEGGFYSSLDADSEGHEGKFYVWSPDEVRAELGPADGDLFCRIYGIERAGNFEGKSIPNLLGGSLADRARELGTTEEELVLRLAPLRARLLAARGRRVRPATDDKVLTAWNGLMITAFARAYQAFGRDEDLRSARRAADFVRRHLSRDGRWLASCRGGTAHLNAYLDDHAFLARGLLDLYEASFERVHLDDAVAVARTMVARFADPVAGGFFFTSDDHEPLLTRTRSVHDGALPAGSGVAAETLLRLATHLADDDLRAAGRGALRALRPVLERAPAAFGALLAAADFAEGPVREIAVVGDPRDAATAALLAVPRGRYLPNRVVAFRAPGDPSDALPLLRGKEQVAGRPAAYVCRDHACSAPTGDPAELARMLEG